MIFDLRNSLRILELPVGRAQTRRAWRLPFSMGSRYEFVYDLFVDSLPVEVFRFGTAEIGHIHTGEDVEIPFPRSVRDALLADGLAEEHRWVPNSGWITFQVRDEGDIKHAVWLMRLSYLRYALKAASDPRRVLDEYGEELQ